MTRASYFTQYRLNLRVTEGLIKRKKKTQGTAF